MRTMTVKGLMGKTDGGVENTIPDVIFEPKFPKPLDSKITNRNLKADKLQTKIILLCRF